jgi:CIC family chloride channel protein
VRTIPLLLISALTGAATGAWFLEKGPLFAMPLHLGIHFGFDRSTTLALLLPALMGLLGPVYYKLIHSLRSASRWPLPLLWSGALVGLLSLKSSLIWGNGDAALLQIAQSSPAEWALVAVLILRLCATIFCVGTGTVGGVFTPTIFAGGAVGYLVALLFHVPGPVFFSLLGMGCLLASTTHAPLMASFMAVELTGQWSLAPYVLTAGFIAWAIARKISQHSLYAIATPEPADETVEDRPRDRGMNRRREEATLMETIEAGE